MGFKHTLDMGQSQTGDNTIHTQFVNIVQAHNVWDTGTHRGNEYTRQTHIDFTCIRSAIHDFCIVKLHTYGR